MNQKKIKEQLFILHYQFINNLQIYKSIQIYRYKSYNLYICKESVICKELMQTILIIEDEPILQKALSVALQQAGYEIKSALEGETGLKLAKEIKPNLILLDLILPKMDGFEILSELKKDESAKDIPVIILTNLESSQDIERALVLGAKTYLVKANYDLKDVIQKVKENISTKN